jgi:23S rRNA-/tRNA-specific pseudouridylate synthase
MNRPIDYFEIKSPDQSVLLSKWAPQVLTKINEPPTFQSSRHWVIYSNDRRVGDWKKHVRPRSKMVFVRHSANPPTLSVLYESKEFIILDKPEGLPTQKTLKDFEDNLYDQAKHFFIYENHFPQGLPYVGLHHRLDRGTSGLVLMTRQRSINKEVSELFKQRQIQKEYWAYVAWGKERLPSKWLQKDKIQRGPARKKKFFFEVGEGGDEAISQFEVLEGKPDLYYKLLCRPITGRTHQLRVQLAHRGHPILGDSIYGQKNTASRLMLQAQKLQFKLKDQSYQFESRQVFDETLLKIDKLSHNPQDQTPDTALCKPQ